MHRALSLLALAFAYAGCFALVLAAPNAQSAELTQEQLDAAARVYLGTADCELKQNVHLRALEGKPGHFELTHRKARYTLTPEVTTTGAVRLEDKQAGVVWLQIPAKSMLLNAKAGRREVDGCMHPEQRAESATPAPSIGIAMR